MSLRYGYFDAHRTTRVVDEQTIVEYDRTYNVSDFNDFFKHLVSTNGVFLRSGTTYLYKGNTNYTRCKIEVNSPTIVDYDDDEDPDTQTVKKVRVYVLEGKGLINSHWFIIKPKEAVYLPAPDASNKYYGIFVRYDEGNRDISLAYKLLSTTHNEVVPAGYNTTTKTFDLDENGICELYLGAVLVYGISSKEYREGTVGKVYNHVGESTCPIISHLVYDSAKADADEYVRQYQDEVNEWIQEIQEQGGLNQHLDFIRLHINGDTGHQSSTIDLTSRLGYTYNAYDAFMVYYNGLFLEDGVNYTVFVENNHAKLTVNNNRSDIPDSNCLDIMIIKGSTSDIPNGNGIRY